MGLTNFVLTVAGVSAVVLLLRSDVKQSASIFKRNVKQIRHWLEEETANSSKFSNESQKIVRECASSIDHTTFCYGLDLDLEGKHNIYNCAFKTLNKLAEKLLNWLLDCWQDFKLKSIFNSFSCYILIQGVNPCNKTIIYECFRIII
ncbi:unnamed protein product [Trifolium pratense]|uniref:Uncharacterized protein n=1 Tax=Trifolium pratense TaxID=57577 RepID=A0ACB0LQV2_TRIPR|nr:unnamed protein product [Trifolium pratense]